MTELSPAAYAVLSAVTQRKYSLDPEDVPQLSASIRSGVAIALREAADQLCLRWSELSHPSDILNNIADELEAQ